MYWETQLTREYQEHISKTEDAIQAATLSVWCAPADVKILDDKSHPLEPVHALAIKKSIYLYSWSVTHMYGESNAQMKKIFHRPPFIFAECFQICYANALFWDIIGS